LIPSFLQYYCFDIIVGCCCLVEALLSYNRPMKQLHDMYILILEFNIYKQLVMA